MTFVPYFQRAEPTDTLTIQHDLETAAEDNRTTLLVSDRGHFVGRITKTGEDAYRVTSVGGDIREFGLADTYTVRLVNKHYARVELFPRKQPMSGKDGGSQAAA